VPAADPEYIVAALIRLGSTADPVFVSVIVTFTLEPPLRSSPHRSEQRCITACPLTGTEIRGVLSEERAMLTRHSLTTTAVADAANSSYSLHENYSCRASIEKTNKQFFHDITPPIRKDTSPVQNKTTQTTGTVPHLSERKPAVSQNLAEPIDCIGFPASCQRARPRAC